MFARGVAQGPPLGLLELPLLGRLKQRANGGRTGFDALPSFENGPDLIALVATQLLGASRLWCGRHADLSEGDVGEACRATRSARLCGCPRSQTVDLAREGAPSRRRAETRRSIARATECPRLICEYADPREAQTPEHQRANEKRSAIFFGVGAIRSPSARGVRLGLARKAGRIACPSLDLSRSRRGARCDLRRSTRRPRSPGLRSSRSPGGNW